MKKSKAILVVLLACFVLLAWGCSRADRVSGATEEKEEAPATQEGGTIKSITVSRSPSFGDASQMTRAETAITPDGLVTYTEYKEYDDDGQEYGAGDAPVVSSNTMQVGPDGFQKIADAIEKNDFFELPENIETDVMDGDYVYLTVLMDDGMQYRSGGLVADQEGPRKYQRIFRVIGDVLGSAVQNPQDAG